MAHSWSPKQARLAGRAAVAAFRPSRTAISIGTRRTAIAVRRVLAAILRARIVGTPLLVMSRTPLTLRGMTGHPGLTLFARQRVVPMQWRQGGQRWLATRLVCDLHTGRIANRKPC